MSGVEEVASKQPVDTGMLSFITVAHFHGVNADPAQLMHTLAIGAGETNESDIIKAARSLKLKARLAHVSYEKLTKLPLPAIGKTKDERFFVIAKADAEQVLVLYPEKPGGPKIVKAKDFKDKWNGQIILCTPRFWKEEYHTFGFRWFLPVVRKYKKPLIDVLIAAFTLQILGLFSPVVMQVVIDKVLTHHSYSTLDVLAVALIAIALFETLMTFAKNYIFTQTTSKIDVILGARLFRHLFTLPLAYFETRRVGDTVARVRELENIRQFLTGQPLTALLDTLFIVVYIVVMFIYSPLLTVIVLGSLVAYVILSAIVTPLFRHRLDERFDAGAESQSYLVESVSGAQTVKSLALEPKVQKHWEGLLANYTNASYKTSILSGNASAIGQLIQKVADLGILWFGAHLVISGSLSVGQLVAFRMLSGRVSGPVLRLVQMWQEFQQTGISIKRLGDIFNTRPEPTIDASKTRLPMIEGRISFEKVRFRYRPDAAEVIRDVSFDIAPGTVLGIVGRSGSGKSTLSKLIQRLYIPEAGKVLVDGVDIAIADPAWLRRQIGVVLQENFLFNATIRENIAAQNPTANMERIVEMAKIAGAHEFILELPNAYDTLVGEHGTGLSGGQIQRIAIARALLNNPRILIFDEATSALDYESESIIQRNLKRICQDRTVIIIAHRLSTLKDATKIMALDKGQVVEYDTPENLIEQKGLFYHLRSQQEKGL
ncbi:MAG: type I secretion system permease/ATPase [Candidatus Saccharimonadales bacterium]